MSKPHSGRVQRLQFWAFTCLWRKRLLGEDGQGENEDETKFEWCTVMHSLCTMTQHVLRMSGRVTTCSLTFHCCCNVLPQTPGLHKTQPNRVASHLGGQQCTTSITGLQSKGRLNCVTEGSRDPPVPLPFSTLEGALVPCLMVPFPPFWKQCWGMSFSHHIQLFLPDIPHLKALRGHTSPLR